MAGEFTVGKRLKGMPTSQMIQALRIIQGAMAAGVVVFAGVVLYLSYVVFGPSTSEPSTGDRLVDLLSMVNAVLACVCVILAWLVGRIPLRRFTPPAELDPIAEVPEDSPVFAEFVAALFPARLVRLAMLEGAGLFGLVVCLLAGLCGVVRARPAYLFNMLPAGLMVAYSVVTFPTRQLLRDMLRDRITHR